MTPKSGSPLEGAAQAVDAVRVAVHELDQRENAIVASSDGRAMAGGAMAAQRLEDRLG
ncbi:MAG TPA: hypothetical protein VGA37_13840 [Gemmatimonadales bacterium]